MIQAVIILRHHGFTFVVLPLKKDLFIFRNWVISLLEKYLHINKDQGLAILECFYWPLRM